ncbi:hypothetical protein LGR54_20275 [Ancylobacter sp. Lp-2]|uniref:COG4315 family predicted lipoprotein n=1 Tax=Ancylobacter sp. Lp-2 TaxID=2881339 RepID=UPI001E3553A6|nr:hypothetical protein [Ancylobacter sp. Lp-2]MCB4770951.1 hypothetical protein [Ancylobacter sp. Lp-2]
MTHSFTRFAGLAAGTLLLAGPALAAGMLTGAGGKTLYVFDKDTGGMSACYDACATNWPPYLGKTGDAMKTGWTLVPRKDGAMQWAYDGKPLYYFAGDKKAGEKAGDGRNGVWHVVND